MRQYTAPQVSNMAITKHIGLCPITQSPNHFVNTYVKLFFFFLLFIFGSAKSKGEPPNQTHLTCYAVRIATN